MELIITSAQHSTTSWIATNGANGMSAPQTHLATLDQLLPWLQRSACRQPRVELDESGEDIVITYLTQTGAVSLCTSICYNSTDRDQLIAALREALA